MRCGFFIPRTPTPEWPLVKPPVCINPAIFMQQEKKNQVFAWLFYYKVISFSIWRILRLSLKWLGLNWVQRWTRAEGDMTATDSNCLSKWKCLLCNKGLRYLDIITQVSLMHVRFKTISNMQMVCRLDKNTCNFSSATWSIWWTSQSFGFMYDKLHFSIMLKFRLKLWCTIPLVPVF